MNFVEQAVRRFLTEGPVKTAEVDGWRGLSFTETKPDLLIWHGPDQLAWLERLIRQWLFLSHTDDFGRILAFREEPHIEILEVAPLGLTFEERMRRFSAQPAWLRHHAPLEPHRSKYRLLRS
jgi:hypothetical protein